MTPTLLSLCTGYGGLDMAVTAVTGARTVAVCDVDPGASKILAHRYPGVPNLGDVKTADWAAWAGADIMTAGYPCQPFSHAGNRKGTDDPRHIFPDIARAIRAVGPRLVILENVRAHLVLGFDVVLGALADIGYDARWVCLRASDVGACHRRERLFVAAYPADIGRKRAGIARGRRGGPADPGAPAPDPGGQRHGRGEDADTLGRVDREDAGQALQRERSRVAGHRSAEIFGPYAPAVARWEAVLGRPAPDPTEPTGRNGAHRLSPRFVEWMMGLPAGWVTDVPGLTRPQMLKALGNGVVPQQAAAALHHLSAYETAEAVA